MAKAAAIPDQTAPAKSGPSLVVQIAVLLVMTLIAVGMGFVSAGFIRADAGLEPPAEAKAGEEAAGHAPSDDAHGEGSEVSSLPNVVMLPPITTNLAAPSDIWVRMELAIIFAEAPDPVMTEAIHQDLLAFLRTVRLHQVDGASGFQHLKSDLEDRVRIRSDGKVTGVLIRTLLYE